MPISFATKADVPALVSLLNSAYRGEESKKGWTTEADMISGDKRTDEPTLNNLMDTADAVFLKSENEKGDLQGCVFLHKRESKLYLGMLAVSPLLQAKGTGKALMEAAEEHAIQENCNSIFMRVITGREELIKWYEKQGYHNTRATEPFPENDPFGTPNVPLEFWIMEKKIDADRR